MGKTTGRRIARAAVPGFAAAAVLLAGGCAAPGATGSDDGAPQGSAPAATPTDTASGSPSAPAESGAGAESGGRLDELTVQAPGTMDGYSRERFAHWSSQGDNCDTRDTVLKREGEQVRVDEQCEAVEGRWPSPYDGEVWTEPGDVDIDHVVPLAEAWRSGARGWEDDRREAFANDLTRPQLLAVTDNVNQTKGDDAPDTWKPPRKEYWCTYAEDWITVKHHYELSVTAAEKKALRTMLERC